MTGAHTRREFLALATVALGALAVAAAPGEAGEGERMILDGIDRFRVREPHFEGVRILLAARDEKYTPAYIQGISGAAFRVAGICPCAPNRSKQMETTDLIKLLGYGHSVHILGWTGDVNDARENLKTLIPKIKESVRAGQPVLLWYAFADTAYEVVCGFDDAAGIFLGWHMHQSPTDPMAKAKQTRAQDTVSNCPALGAIFIEEKVGKLDAKAAEIAALREAVRHARDAQVRKDGPPRSGLACYDRWVEDFKKPETKRDAGSSHCQQVYRSTHRAAGEFLIEIAPRYPKASDALLAAAKAFTAEADALDEATPLIGWKSPELSPDRNAKLWPILARARDHYAAAIGHLEKALPDLE